MHVVYSNKIHIHETLVDMHGPCNFGAITVSLTCERFVPDRILN